jgi:hypothetical protein
VVRNFRKAAAVGAAGAVDQDIDTAQPGNRLLHRGPDGSRIGHVELVKDAETIITLGNAGTEGFVILDALQLVEAAP